MTTRTPTDIGQMQASALCSAIMSESGLPSYLGSLSGVHPSPATRAEADSTESEPQLVLLTVPSATDVEED